MTQPSAPRYLKIAEELRNNLHNQIYQIDQKLPTETELADQFGVNRHTLRQAIAVLRQEGLLRVEQGRGTFVAAAPIRYPIGKRVRYNESLNAQGVQAQYRLLTAAIVPATPTIAQALAVEPEADVALIESLSSSTELPLCLTSGYFPLNRFPDILTDESLALLQSLNSVSKWLQQQYGCDHLRQQTTVSARIVQLQDAPLLQLPLNQPILLAESINIDQTGQVIEYGVSRFRGDRMELVFTNDD